MLEGWKVRIGTVVMGLVNMRQTEVGGNVVGMGKFCVCFILCEWVYEI